MEIGESLAVDIASQLEKAVKFWLDFSLDQEKGGYYNCISREGKIYDSTKYGWLQGRQVYMLTRLYNEKQAFHRANVLQAALHGAKFLRSKVKSQDGSLRCHFAMDRDGNCLKIQRTIFTESFYAIAMCELHTATKEREYLEEATTMIDKIIYWSFDNPAELGVQASSAVGSRPLNVPMIVLDTLEQLYRADTSQTINYMPVSRKCARMILQHNVKVDGRSYIVENIDSNGGVLEGSSGHLLCPGHAIEAGWFLLTYSERDTDSELSTDLIIQEFIMNPLQYGWDQQYGGLYYFLDCRGSDYTPATHIEWFMKLWWPHCETLIALLMAYKHSERKDMLDHFKRVYDYTKKHFVDDEFGEWYGYLQQDGTPSSLDKGAPFKGCFHVPRSLMLCDQLLRTVKID